MFLPAHSILRILQAELSIKLEVYSAPRWWQQFPWQQQVAGISVGVAWAEDDSTRRRYQEVFVFVIQFCGEVIAVC